MQGLRGLKGQIGFGDLASGVAGLQAARGGCWRARPGGILSGLECQGQEQGLYPEDSRAVSWSGVSVEANGERLEQCDPREKRGKEVPTPVPAPPRIPHSRFSKGLKFWVVTILHFSPVRHITRMLMMSTLVSF